ncbi:WD repeat-containing protein 41 isoform 1-T3 [Clarias gariepinus]|uniref:WD repeat-containing protein 41 n=1 Tax=Clarias gariepinus TaxID=13013 RepID=UPI00234DD078|nr:WD repeat-containing protein 41 [Clarias gariepinus]XP_053333825.1 WD repeat-containing protein 41 [Clarias gariepinus]XP_053333826.1 WD repeat-containing protein 41 [Clarias gariepinus]
MLRWILGTRGSHGSAENRYAALCIGEDQPKNSYTELQVLRGHFDIVRFLVQIDDIRFASAGDDGMVFVWNVETGERLVELRAHTQQITALTAYTCTNAEKTLSALITASSDRMMCLWDADTGQRLHLVSNLQSSVKCVLVLDHLDVFLSGGNELCVWNQDFQLQCKAVHYRDSGITALMDLPKSCVAAAIDKEIVIFKLNLSENEMSILAVRHLTDHQDTIRTLIRVNDDMFASGSHIGEVILWDSLDWTIQSYERILWEEPDREGQSEIRMGQQKQSEASIQHLHSDGELVVAAVGSGLFVYNTRMKTVVAYRKFAHDSDVLYTTVLHNRQVMSCSEDGSVRIWELQELPLPAEPASSGFFGLFGTIGRSNKHGSVPSKKLLEVSGLCSLELVGDLIGHSGAVQMFLSFGNSRVVTCSADHLLILWKDGERESHLRSLALFLKLEEKGCL